MLAKRYRLPAAFFKGSPLVRPHKKENDFFVVRRYPSVRGYTRFAVVISKKVAPGAVVRTRMRRSLYEYIRVQRGWARPGGDVVVMVRAPLIGDRAHVSRVLQREGGIILG